ncbi:MAG: redoxin domain-containing protein [Bacteroidetes bacterium]|nr:redoxin domain-containing protein [Bacteroidota bacterium]
MKKLIQLALAFLLVYGCSSRPEKILKISKDKCQSIENGRYHMDHITKYMTQTDTVKREYDCIFSKLENDTIYPAKFHYSYTFNGKYGGDILYTSSEFVNYKTTDSAGTIMSNEKWSDKIDAYKHNYNFYDVVFRTNASPLPDDSMYHHTGFNIKSLKAANLNNHKCFRIQTIQTPKPDTSEAMQILSITNDYWIDKKSMIPVRYSSLYLITMEKDTMTQLNIKTIRNSQFDIPGLGDSISLNRVPEYVKLEEFKPYVPPTLLPVDTIAPVWKLPTLRDSTDSLSLMELKGKIVLIDFFYKGCYPCMQAIPGLQKLSEAYKEKGVEVVGIDPFDNNENNNLSDFLEKRGASYQILMDGKSASDNYHVSGYPTMYVIDREGIIRQVNVGFGDGTDELLEQYIEEILAESPVN